MIEFYTIAIIALLGAISPGPDFVVTTKNAISHSRRSGYFTAFGITTGILVHSSYCILGLAVIISQSLLLFSIIRYCGAAYLIYLGIKGLFTKSIQKKLTPAIEKTGLTDKKAFSQGFIVNVINPKCILFMLSIFTLVIKPHTPYWVQIIFGLELALITGAWFCFLSYLLTHKHVNSKIQKAQKVVTKVMGAFLIGFGLDLIFSHLGGRR